MSQTIEGDCANLDGPTTMVSKCIVDKNGEIINTIHLYTEYHKSKGYSKPVYFIGKSDGGKDLIVIDIRNHDELIEIIGSYTLLKEVVS